MAEEVVAAVAVEAVVDAAVAEVATDVAVAGIADAAIGAGVAEGAIGAIEAAALAEGAGAFEASLLAGAATQGGTVALAEMSPVLLTEATEAAQAAGVSGDVVSVTQVPSYYTDWGDLIPQQTYATVVDNVTGEVVNVPFEPSPAPLEANIPGTTLPDAGGSTPTSFGASDILRAGGVVTTAVGGVQEALTGGISDQLRSAGQTIGAAGSALNTVKATGALDMASLAALVKPLVDIVGNDTAVAALLGQILQQAVVPLLKDLGGTFGKLALGVLPSMGVLSTSSVKILGALIEGKDIPADSLLGASREILMTTRRIAGPGAAGVLGPALTLISRSIPRYTRKREQLLTELGIADPATDLTDDQRSALMDRLFGGESPETVASELQFGQVQLAGAEQLLPVIGRIAKWVLQLVGLPVALEVMDRLKDSYPEVAEKILGTMAPAGNMMIHGVEALHKPMQLVLETASSFLFEHIHGELDKLGLVGPDEVLEVAPKLLAAAGGLGMSAHLTAIAAEKIHFLKELGFPQLAAFLVDMAGFSGIAKNTVGQHFDAALSIPSRRAALKRFRPDLPDPRSLEQQFHWRLIDEETVRDWYREHGWREETVNAQLASMWRLPNPRELAFIFEDAHVDEAWLFQTVQRNGYRDADAEKVVKGIVSRSQSKLRAQLYQQAFDAFENGHLSAEGLDQILVPLDIRPEVRELYLQIATLKRYSKWYDQIFQAYQDAAAVGQYTPEELAAHLVAHGATPDVVYQHQSLAAIRNGRRLYTKAQSELTSEQRKARDTALGNAQALYRRFLIDDAQLDAALTEAGIIHEEVAALVAKAKIARTPVPELPTELSADAQQQQALFRQRDSVLAMQANGLVDAPTAEAFLLGLGLDPVEAASRANLVASRLAHPPKPVKPPKPDPAVVARERAAGAAVKAAERADAAQLAREQRLHRDAVITLFRGELLTAHELYAQLVAFGYEASEAAAIVEREVARVVSKAQHDADKQAAKDEAAAIKAASQPDDSSA